MAYETNVGLDFTFKANTDLSAKQYYFATLASTGYLTVSTAGQRAIGVIQDGPVGTASDVRACSVRYGGVTKVLCGGSFVIGDLIASDSAGKAVKYTGATVFTGTPYTVSGSQVLGVALEAGSSGQMAAMLLWPQGLSA